MKTWKIKLDPNADKNFLNNDLFNKVQVLVGIPSNENSFIGMKPNDNLEYYPTNSRKMTEKQRIAGFEIKGIIVYQSIEDMCHYEGLGNSDNYKETLNSTFKYLQTLNSILIPGLITPQQKLEAIKKYGVMVIKKQPSREYM